MCRVKITSSVSGSQPDESWASPYGKEVAVKAPLAALLFAILVTPLAVFAQAPPAPAVGLHMAALTGNLQAIQQHIDAGSDLNQLDAYGSSPLAIASIFGKTDIAVALIEAGADLGVRNSQGATPLHNAALFCRTDIVQSLLDNGADRYLRDSYGNTPSDAVAADFEDVKGIYDTLGQALAPMGLQLDYEHIKATRPLIVQMLRPSAEALSAVDYAPLERVDWPVSTPDAQGLDPQLVAELYLDAAHMPKLYSLLVIKDGKLIAEAYFNEGSVDQKTRVQSVTKSYTSALTGIALGQGLLSGVDQKMVELFPEIADQLTDPRKKEITVGQLLQMRGGYPWEEMDPAHWTRVLTGEYVDDIEIIPLVGEPGTLFNYSNLSSNWLGIIVSRASGTSMKAYAEANLFKPLGVVPGEWGTDAHGHNNGCGDLHMSARDMARFGSLYMNEGRYQDKQIIPAEWVEASLADYSPDAWVTRDKVNHAGPYFSELGYGYQWWSASVGERRFNLAWGHGGQLIILLEDLDMMVVTTTDPFHLEHNDEAWMHEKSTVNLVGKFILSLPME
jgi:CubicO group peptidase (beta-lactamase class C family)